MDSGEEFCILVAEDDAVTRAVFADALVGKGYCVLQAEDGEAALRAAAAYDGLIHVLVTDIHMPGLDGRGLAQQLKPTRPDLQILIISSQRVEEYPPDSYHDASLEKPVSPKLVVSTVERLLQRRHDKTAG